MGSNADKQWLYSFPAQLSAATLFTPLEICAFYRETVIEADVASNKPTEEGMEFLRFRSGARVAKKHKKTDADDDDDSGFRRKDYMIPVAYPGIIVKGSFLRELPLVHHCVLVRTGSIFAKNPYKTNNIDPTQPEAHTILALFAMYNDRYPVYKIHRHEIQLLPLRQMANLVTPVRPAPERAESPEYKGTFTPFSFVDADSAVGFLTLYRRRRFGPPSRRQNTVDADGNEVRLPPTTLWKERRAADSEWGMPAMTADQITAANTNPTSALIDATLQLLKRYPKFPFHVRHDRQKLPYLADSNERTGVQSNHISIMDHWKMQAHAAIKWASTDETRGEFVRTILLSFLTARVDVLMQLEAASLPVVTGIVRDIAYQMIIAGAALIWKNDWSLEIRYRSYPVFDMLCKNYFGKLYYDNAKRLTTVEQDRGACVRTGMVTYYEKFAKPQDEDSYSHMYEIVDLTYNIRDHASYPRTLFREKILYAAPCPWAKASRWLMSSWSDFEMSCAVASWLLNLSKKRVSFVPHTHRELRNIAVEGGVDDGDTRLTENMPRGTVLFDEELYQQILRDHKFVTYDGHTIELTDEQLSAVRSLKSSALTNLLGDPGTGKSTMFQVFLKLFGVENVHICCAYNTMASMHAKTALYSTSIDSANARFTRYADARKSDVSSTAKARVLIVDEIGVVRLYHARMLANIYDADIIIFAGDINQMKAIGRGEILQGMMDVFENDAKVTTTLTVAHRANVGIARVHIANCLECIKVGRGERIFGTVDVIARPPICFLSHRSVNSSTHIPDTFAPIVERFGGDVNFWKNFICICRTHKIRREIQEFFLRTSPLTRDIVRRRGFLSHRDLAIGELLKVTSRFKPYEREAPPLVPSDLGTAALMRVTRVLDLFTDGEMSKQNKHLVAILGGYLSKEALATHLENVEVDDLETTLSPTSLANKHRSRARLIILDGGDASFILTDKTRDCYERGNVVTVASIQGGQFDNVALYFTPTSTAAGANVGSFTEEKSMLYTGSSRAKSRIFFMGSKTLVGDISRRLAPPRRNLFTAIIRQMAGMKPFDRTFDGDDTYLLPLDEADYIQYEHM